jgi:4-hydroxy-tetrahydrodipicolinate synthase
LDENNGPLRTTLGENETTSFRKHLRDVASVEGLSAITINAHSTEVGSCTFDEQRSILEIAQEEIGTKLPLINGIWADDSIEAARLARMATQGGASALLVFPPTPFTLGQSPQMALAHFKRIADATELPLIVFQYPLATGQGYPKETLLKLCEEVPTIRACDIRFHFFAALLLQRAHIEHISELHFTFQDLLVSLV